MRRGAVSMTGKPPFALTVSGLSEPAPRVGAVIGALLIHESTRDVLAKIPYGVRGGPKTHSLGSANFRNVSKCWISVSSRRS
jgi:hypothetical protein